MRLLMFVAAMLSLLVLSPAAATAQSATPAATPAAAAPSLSPVIWELQAFVAPDGTSSPVDQPGNYTLQVEGSGQVFLRADCNRGFGKATVDGNAVTLGNLGVSMMMCPDGSRDHEFLQGLSNATTWAYDNDALVLSAADGSALRFNPTLAGVVWQWQRTQMMDDSVVTPADPAGYTLEFSEDGKLVVQADCNRAFGSFETDGPKIDIKALGMTKMACPDGSMDVAFLQNLNDAVAHTFRDGRLYFDLPMDGGILEFAPVTPHQLEQEAATPVAN